MLGAASEIDSFKAAQINAKFKVNFASEKKKMGSTRNARTLNLASRFATEAVQKENIYFARRKCKQLKWFFLNKQVI